MFDFPFANQSKGAPSKPLMSDDRALLVQPAGLDYYHLAKQGLIFTGNMAATGLVLPIFSNTAQVCGIWNPAGSGVNAVLMGVRGTYVDTTGATGGYCLGIMKDAGRWGVAEPEVFALGRGTVKSALTGNSMFADAAGEHASRLLYEAMAKFGYEDVLTYLSENIRLV